jgi:hypothetical protein
LEFDKSFLEEVPVPTGQIAVHPDQSVSLTTYNGILVREDTAFTNRKGVEKRGIRKRAEQALDKLQEPLRKILEPDEAVLYLARGQIMPGGIEQFFLGWHSYFLAPAMLVLTNRRLIHLLITRNGAWKKSTRSARWGDIEEAKVKGLLSAKLNIKYRDGTKEIYWGMVHDDSNKIQLLLEVLLPQAGGETSSTLAMTNSCPECSAALTPGVYECPRCRLQFKDEKTAMKRSILIPGGGFFYTGHPFLGLMHAITDLILIVFAGVSAITALGIMQPPPAPDEKSTALVIVAMMVAILAFHKWMLIRVAQRLVRNYIPAS